jgi:hypothetical protein
MYRKYGVAALFSGNGFARREIFNHYVIVVPKAYPDAQLLLERSGLTRRDWWYDFRA